jgi:hypothetical protein
MHPVLKQALQPVADQISTLTAEQAQIPPSTAAGRWCAQEIVEHLILTYEQTSDSLSRQLNTGRLPKRRRNLLESFLRVQTIGLGYMPAGVPAQRATRPGGHTAEPGTQIAKRFLAAAEAMDELLVACRKKFGIEASGEHPFYGVMRVDEWRRYHAIHARHHLPQLRAAARNAQIQRSA